LTIRKRLSLFKNMLELFIFLNSLTFVHLFPRSVKLVLFYFIKKKKDHFDEWPYAESTFLPLRRRAARILRPLFVLILARKP
jgi:hypothetical protein